MAVSRPANPANTRVALKIFLVGLIMVNLASCVGAYQVAPVAPRLTGPVTPTMPDPDAGLVGIAPGADLRPYTVLLVDRFDVPSSELKDVEDRDVADRLAPLFQTELITRIRAAGLFDRVVNLSETTFTPSEGVRVLRLEGTLARLNTGSRALRYFVGFGAGASKAQVETRLVEAATGRLLIVAADRREAAFGVFGGDGEEHLREALSDSARDYAKFLARVKNAAPAPVPSDKITPTAATGSQVVARAAPVDLPGIWRESEQRAVLRITGNGSAVQWDLESNDRRFVLGFTFSAFAGGMYRASGKGSVAGDEVILTGRVVSGDGYSINLPVTMTLTRDERRLSGTILGGARNVPVKVEFERSP
jgi:hypothetical protein